MFLHHFMEHMPIAADIIFHIIVVAKMFVLM